ncbi:VanZ family protein [Amphibacillus sediminis]|uniref:VanZ family protein n=1 Tax=Amphibacillus sediminis TaxID=360185 RepID=UPI000831A38C|nr:VanZ family protein [Amphibacillus sediminis]
MLIDFNYSFRLLSALVFILLAFYLRLKKLRSFSYLLFFGAFYFYMMLVINYTQFPIITDLDPTYHSLSEAFVFVPNHPFTDFNTSMFLNTLLTIPFGFLVPFLKKVNFKLIFKYGLILTLSIELLQLSVYLLLGAHNRHIDINDFIYNMFGVILGYFLFKLFCVIFLSLMTKFKIDSNTFLEFILKIAKDYQLKNKQAEN